MDTRLRHQPQRHLPFLVQRRFFAFGFTSLHARRLWHVGYRPRIWYSGSRSYRSQVAYRLIDQTGGHIFYWAEVLLGQSGRQQWPLTGFPVLMGLRLLQELV